MATTLQIIYAVRRGFHPGKFPQFINAGSLLKTAFSDQPQTIYCAEIEGCGLDYPAKLYFDKKTNHIFLWILKTPNLHRSDSNDYDVI